MGPVYFMGMKISFFILLSALVLAPQLSADEGEAGQPGGFLRVGVGARALALGNAYSAVASGPEAALWNPAGLALLPRGALESSVSDLSLGRQFDDASIAFPVGTNGRGWGTWSLSWLRFSLGNDFEGRQTDTASYYSFADEQSAYVLSHGRLLTDWLAVGGGVEYVEHSIDIYSASGFGCNAGLLLIPLPRLHIAVSVSELLSQISWSTGYVEQFPYTIRMGVSMLLLKDWLLLSGQGTGVEGQQASYQAGLELRYSGLLAARVGINEDGVTFGGGISVPVFKSRVSFDYAFAPDALDEGNTQRFSLGLIF
jgi:hypothetical protein